MSRKLTLYSRRDCYLCADMKSVIAEVAARIPMELEEIDVDGNDELREKFGNDVPVLFIDGRKAFKYRVTAKELQRRFRRRTLWARLGLAKKGE